MNFIRNFGRLAAFLALAGLMLITIVAIRHTTARAQTGGPYDLSWSTVDGGGHTFSTGGDYSLGGTIGQPDPGLLTGGDYTLGIGSGLYVLAEHFILANAPSVLGRGEGLKFTALSFRYPVGLLDNLSAFVYYDWKNEQFFRFLSWQRTYDRWQLFLIGFWNPEDSPFFQTQQGNNLFAGAGFQVMVVLNH